DLLTRMGPAPLSEIAAVLGRPADGLYYHVRALERVGIVVSDAARTRAGRAQAVFHTSGRDFALRYAAAPGRHARTVTAIIASMMRLGIRDFRGALANPANRLDGPRRDVWALRATGWLSASQ